jgi:hypothetical protein
MALYKLTSNLILSYTNIVDEMNEAGFTLEQEERNRVLGEK